MSRIRRNWERLPDEDKAKVKEDLILFFENERDEKIGTIAAEEILNFFLENIGPMLYNKGVTDSKKAIEGRMDELRYDLDDLMIV